MTNDDLQIINKIEDIKDEAIFTLAKLVNLYGLTLSESRLFSTMFIESNPMTLDELSKSLGMSKSSMSTGVRSLLDAQMVEKKWRKGMRKDLYIVEEDLYKTFSSAFIEQWHSVIHQNTNLFNEILEHLNNISLEVDEEDTNLHASLSQYSQKIESVIEFNKWLAELFKDIQEKIKTKKI